MNMAGQAQNANDARELALLRGCQNTLVSLDALIGSLTAQKRPNLTLLTLRRAKRARCSIPERPTPMSYCCGIPAECSFVTVYPQILLQSRKRSILLQCC